jgi:DNA-binding NarL/FixJ family response regulator
MQPSLCIGVAILCFSGLFNDEFSLACRVRRIPSEVKLSTGEEAILIDPLDGAPNNVIAQRFNITEATVKAHVKAILRKIRVKNRTQAAIWGTKISRD